MIAVKIDVTKIQKDRLYHGKKGTYLDALLIATRDNAYGDDFMIVQSVSKEERDKGIKGPIIGNARDLTKTQTPRATRSHDEDDVPADPKEDVPF